MRTLAIALVLLISNILSAQDDNPLIGKWDMTFLIDGEERPSWLEVKNSGYNTLVGHFVYAFGSARPISEVRIKDGVFAFSIPRQWEPEGKDMSFIGSLVNEKLKGTMIYTDGVRYDFTGVRAPKLKYTSDPTWGEPQDLLSSGELGAWSATADNQWKMISGVLTSDKSGANLISNAKFDDFKLHIEFRYPAESNSGIYLRGRYEVQIADNYGMDPSSILFGGVYGFLAPTEMVAMEAGKWQSFDITLIGNRVTIIANGKPVIIDRTIPGITGGAIDSKEGQPGPFMLQGDHGPIEFRNIIVTPRIGS